jgi:hypothetical protein
LASESTPNFLGEQIGYQKPGFIGSDGGEQPCFGRLQIGVPGPLLSFRIMFQSDATVAIAAHLNRAAA